MRPSSVDVAAVAAYRPGQTRTDEDRLGQARTGQDMGELGEEGIRAVIKYQVLVHTGHTGT